ncbi:MAG: 23S rRNA (uracil(1939)-C(5))-methyltransferase RlmD [Proteobacteria bacterium]|nr:23S rRNA (uracil(1939)-C(5))-methyltransferase RlmD [Burkholderiales bacterium]
MPSVVIESLDQDGRGVARLDGKTVFVDGALPGERVRIASWMRKPTYEFADAVMIEQASASRVTPRCAHFGVCGGCAMQHIEPRTQVAAKQRVLEDNLRHIGRVQPDIMLSPIHGPTWGYRYRARLSVRLVVKKGGVLVGFHEKRSSFIADMRECHVLAPVVARLLVPLRALVASLSIADRMPQIEVAVTDPAFTGAAEAGSAHCVLVFRNLAPLTAQDEATLRDFADAQGVQIFLQPQGPDTAHPLHPVEPALLEYRLSEFDVRLRFAPTEFTQVNHAVNEILVRRAIGLLDPRAGERVADFFCGLGNFSLPIAARGASVIGVEGAKSLIARARDNAALNRLDARVRFECADLFKATPDSLAGLGHLDKWLIDPPRDGALALVKAIGEPTSVSTVLQGPSRIVYVSCSPATLARDAGVLVHTKGYSLRAAGVINMFPHTGHVESIAWFEREHSTTLPAPDLPSGESEAK